MESSYFIIFRIISVTWTPVISMMMKKMTMMTKKMIMKMKSTFQILMTMKKKMRIVTRRLAVRKPTRVSGMSASLEKWPEHYHIWHLNVKTIEKPRNTHAYRISNHYLNLFVLPANKTLFKLIV